MKKDLQRMTQSLTPLKYLRLAEKFLNKLEKEIIDRKVQAW